MPQTVNIPERLPISIDSDALAALCRRYGIRELALFGSVLRDDFSSQSDIDVLYETGPTSSIRSLFDLGRLVGDLEDFGWTSRRCGQQATALSRIAGGNPFDAAGHLCRNVTTSVLGKLPTRRVRASSP